MQKGDWQRMVRDLTWLDPANAEQVAEVGRALDGVTVRLSAGTLVMGREDGAQDERPVHEVQVSPLDLDRFEVTNAQYQRFVDGTGHAPPASWSGGRFPLGQALHPVTSVTWHDAQDYAAWAGKRLPTEAEWEWAARGSQGRLYPWGNELDPAQANFRSSAQTPKGSSAVGTFPGDATPEGVMGLAGNVREWTADRYGPYRVPHAPPTEGTETAVRGKSWRTYNDAASARDRAPENEAADDLGFRCAR
jgi:formylglycine-generating enzyme required for sulfatase activity